MTVQRRQLVALRQRGAGAELGVCHWQSWSWRQRGRQRWRQRWGAAALLGHWLWLLALWLLLALQREEVLM
jgi:hypothetical protein